MLALNLRSGLRLMPRDRSDDAEAGYGSVAQRRRQSGGRNQPGRRSGLRRPAKAAAVAMINSLAADLRGTGVRVNSLLPSVIDTEPDRKAMPEGRLLEVGRNRRTSQKSFCFLCSNDAKLIHGASIPV